MLALLPLLLAATSQAQPIKRWTQSNANCQGFHADVHAEWWNANLTSITEGYLENEVTWTAWKTQIQLKIGSTVKSRIAAAPTSIHVNETFPMWFEYCTPKSGSPKGVFQAIHGIVGAAGYWNVLIDGHVDNSFAESAAAAGWATLYYDRLGVGRSAHPPDGVNTVQATYEIAQAIEIANKLRSGGFDGIPAFDKVVGVGHSAGAEILSGVARTSPDTYDALALTGYTHNLTTGPLGVGQLRADLINTWYKREEATLRSAFYFNMNNVCAIAVGLCNYGIARKSEDNGYSGWRSICFFLGGLSFFFGLLAVVFLEVPARAWWLSAEEKQIAHARTLSNGTTGAEQHPWKWSQCRECLRDPQFWLFMVFTVTSQIPNGASTTFQGLVFQSFGFSSLDTLLLQLPLQGVNLIMLLGFGYLFHRKYRTRFPSIIVIIFGALIVFMYLGLARNANRWQKWSCYTFALCYACAPYFIWPTIPLQVAGRTKRSFILGCNFVLYCVGNITGANVFRPHDAPLYRHGLTAVAVVLCFEAVVVAAMWFHYRRANKKRAAIIAASGISEEEQAHRNKLAGELDKTDLENIYFKYFD